MSFLKKAWFLLTVVFLLVPHSRAQVDSNFHCYLLFGQSNMAGGGSGIPFGTAGPSDTVIAADCDTSTRIRVLAFCDCSAKYSADCPKFTQSRKTDTWYTAYPPLHICAEGISPGDWFAKTMLDSIREDIKIGLIPCALSGQGLGVFEKGGKNFNIPNWAHPTLANSSPYDWMLARCKLAQQTGVIKGFLLHQGESGPGAPTWPTMAKGILDNLKKDLGIDANAPFPVIVGELRQDNYAGFNKDCVAALAKAYPNCGVASSAGLAVQSDDGFHFAAAGMREFGKRYANAFLKIAGASYVPRKGTSHIIAEPAASQRACLYQAMTSASSSVKVYSIDGRLMKSISASNAGNVLHNMKTAGVYIVSRTLNDGRSAIVPFIKE
jgi:hypothetical protein